VRPAIQKGPSSVLVMALPNRPKRSWAYFGPEARARFKWLHGAD
jgi:hypothetical protein